MLNIKYLSVRQEAGLPGFETFYRGSDGLVMENLNVLPKAWFADSVVTMDSQAEVLEQVSSDFDPSERAFVASDREFSARPRFFI